MTQDRAETFATLCRQKGLRLTGQRRVISEIIASGLDHPCANQIHDLAVRRQPRISLATVYRTLRTLCEVGLVTEHAFKDGRCHYELAGGPHHDHLIDGETGEIVEFFDEEIERLQREVAARLGYRLTGHRLELYAVKHAQSTN